MILYEHIGLHNAHLNPINFTVCPYLQQDATYAAYQELGHILRSKKWQYHSKFDILSVCVCVCYGPLWENMTHMWIQNSIKFIICPFYSRTQLIQPTKN
jgi:hypothetical protein